MTDVVSVLIPVYNRQDVIEECVRSVLMQSHQSFEILLVDDGSSDSTPAICQALAEQDPRIKLLAMNHAGVSAARNRGLDEAQGEYVFFLDSDDMIHPLLLETLVNGLKTGNVKIAGSAVASVGETHWCKVRKKLKEPSALGETVCKSNAEALHAMFHGGSPLNLLGGVLMCREYIGNTRFRTDLFIGEDYYFIYENLVKGSGAVFLHEKWYYARLHSSNTSRNWSYSGFWTRFFRRQLVWECEEAAGRTEYANIQKRDAFACFTTCLRKNGPGSPDSRKMCRKIREYRAVLFPALPYKQKLSYFLAVYIPALYLKIVPLTRKRKA